MFSIHVQNTGSALYDITNTWYLQSMLGKVHRTIIWIDMSDIMEMMDTLAGWGIKIWWKSRPPNTAKYCHTQTHKVHTPFKLCHTYYHTSVTHLLSHNYYSFTAHDEKHSCSKFLQIDFNFKKFSWIWCIRFSHYIKTAFNHIKCKWFGIDLVKIKNQISQNMFSKKKWFP